VQKMSLLLAFRLALANLFSVSLRFVFVMPFNLGLVFVVGGDVLANPAKSGSFGTRMPTTHARHMVCPHARRMGTWLLPSSPSNVHAKGAQQAKQLGTAAVIM
jgi:hypothetical protein